jgi:hypothetical protein
MIVSQSIANNAEEESDVNDDARKDEVNQKSKKSIRNFFFNKF